MARSKEAIYSGLQNGLVKAAAAVGITIYPSNWSKYDYKALTLKACAESQSISEQIYDSYQKDIEDKAEKLPPATFLYFQNLMLNLFEYDDVAAPIVQLDPETFTPYYPSPNPNYRVVKFCSVVSGDLGTTVVKIAGSGPSQLSQQVVDTAKTFMDTIGVPGIRYEVLSGVSDKLFMELDVYYNGLYSAVIRSRVKSSIDSYLSGISFNGVIKIQDLLIKIKSVEGVIDCFFGKISARDNSTSVTSGYVLSTATYTAAGGVNTNTTLDIDWQTVSGYIIAETTSGYDLDSDRQGFPGVKNLNLIPA